MPDSQDGGAYELGLNITPSVDGFITGVRFYKSAANTGTHTGSLWSSTGQRLATATFTAETASGWQEVRFSPAGCSLGRAEVRHLLLRTERPLRHQGLPVGELRPDRRAADGGRWLRERSGRCVRRRRVRSRQTATSTATTSWTPSSTRSTRSDLTASGHWPLDGSSSVPQATTVGAVFSKPVTAASVQLTADGRRRAGRRHHRLTTPPRGRSTFTPSTPAWHSAPIYTADAARHGRRAAAR